MADILCPNCGMPNPDDQNTCSFCRQPLHVASDKEAIRPGDMPTKKTTAELEPILPEWLRDVRARARQETQGEQEQQAKPEESAEAQPAANDWLAGLEAAGREEKEEDIPDWMRSLSPAQPTPPAPKQETPPKAEEVFPRREEIRWEDEPAPAPRLSEPPPTGPLGATKSDDGIPYWLKNVQAESGEAAHETAGPTPPPTAPTPAEPATPFESGTFRPNTGELIDWLGKMAPETGESAPILPSAEEPASEPPPDWIAKLDNQSSAPAPAPEETPTVDSAFSFDWLKDESSKPFAPFEGTAPVQESAATGEAVPAEEESAPTPAEISAQADLPDWMRSLEGTPAPTEGQGQTDLPDWMRTFESSSASATESEQSDLPDWIKSATQAPALPKEEAETPGAETLAEPSKPAEEKPFQPPSIPAFVQSEEPSATDELFSVDMPDWLSNIAPTESKSAPAAQPAAEQAPEIARAELPSWVQAMRPVEAALSGAPAAQESVPQSAETQGPLAGLEGVLPALPDFSPAGKPKIYSIRLEPTRDQQEHSNLLEQMLAAETQPKPMRTEHVLLGSQRVLRWVVTGVLFVLIAALLVLRLQLTPLPIALSPESANALPVLDALPDNAPVLLVFDYEPALAGELESAAAPFVERMSALHKPNFSLISTSPTGAALATRFFEDSNLAQFLNNGHAANLGYLPGESSGILSFAMNPRAVKPNDTAWNLPAAQNVNAFSDYALVVLLTDRSEAARAWVEQTSAYRNGRPLVVVSSAQAAPMIQPYMLSGQVNGMIVGLRDGAAFESAFGQTGAARTYWDAYNFSALLAVIMIVIGGAWNFVQGLRARRQEMADA